MKLLSLALFLPGLFAFAYGVFNGKLEGYVVGSVATVLIVWPYNNLRKIKDESTFLGTLVPYTRAKVAVCEAEDKPALVRLCYKGTLQELDAWMTQLRGRAYG